ncbi:MAG: TRAP transporter small permease [Burkholderiales bacterium]
MAALLVLFATVLVAADVVLRNIWRDSVPGDIELSEYAMLFITTFAAPWLLHQGQHVRIDIALKALPPRGGWICEILCDLIGLIFSIVMAYYAARVVIGTHSAGSLITKEFTIPEWWIRSPLLVMFVLLALGFLVRLHSVSTGPRRPRAEGGQI